MVRLKHPFSGVVVEVTPEKADRLGWPVSDEAKTDTETKPAVRKTAK